MLLFVRIAFHELLIVGVLVLFVEASRETEVCELDVATTIEEDIVWFDIAGKRSVGFLHRTVEQKTSNRLDIYKGRGKTIGSCYYAHIGDD